MKRSFLAAAAMAAFSSLFVGVGSSGYLQSGYDHAVPRYRRKGKSSFQIRVDEMVKRKARK